MDSQIAGVAGGGGGAGELLPTEPGMYLFISSFRSLDVYIFVYIDG